MTGYILDKLNAKGLYANDAHEQECLEYGISLFLAENGFGDQRMSGYRMRYVDSMLGMIEGSDLKKFFIAYPAISEVRQIVMEYSDNESLPDERVRDLMLDMRMLYDEGPGERYIPADIVRKMIS